MVKIKLQNHWILNNNRKITIKSLENGKDFSIHQVLIISREHLKLIIHEKNSLKYEINLKLMMSSNGLPLE